MMSPLDPRRPFSIYRTNERILVEGGSYLGGGIQAALDAGFDRVLSYEISTGLYNKTKDRFAGNSNVTVLQKPTQYMYEELKDIDERIVFWLDAHYSFLDTSFHETTCPILEELHEISKHHIKTHTILVDDLRLFGTREFAGVTLGDVKKAILAINPRYVFELADGMKAGDILVARVLSEEVREGVLGTADESVEREPTASQEGQHTAHGEHGAEDDDDCGCISGDVALAGIVETRGRSDPEGSESDGDQRENRQHDTKHDDV